MESMKNVKRAVLSAAQRNFLLDGTLLAGVLLALSPRLTGMAIHEWLSAGLALTLLLHLLWHWEWIVAVLRRLFARMVASSRLNLILNLALFDTFNVAVFSGLMISRVLLASFGLELPHSATWRVLHSQSADLVLMLLAFHLALHWKWILRAARKYVRLPRLSLGQSSLTQPMPAMLPVVVREKAER
jgi:hypothetical protein